MNKDGSQKSDSGLVTVSAKIPKTLRRKLKEYGIRPSEVIRKALEDAVKEAELKIAEKELEKLKESIMKISVEEVLQGIRIEREGGKTRSLNSRRDGK